MKKPHEQEWEKSPVDDLSVIRVDGNKVLGEVCAVSGDADAVALIAAAPRMARALLGLGEEVAGLWHTHECWKAGRGCLVSCQNARRLLRRVGVL